MGGLTSVATTAIQALGAANSILGSVDRYNKDSGRQQYDQVKKQNEIAMKNAQEQAMLQKEELRLNAEKAESERRAALKRAVARQRAEFGASGVGSGAGSSQAVLLGLFDESDEDLKQREALDNLKSRAIDQNISQQQRINTLQLTQLKERDKIKWVTSGIDLLGSLSGSL
jgi:hypothetical protein